MLIDPNNITNYNRTTKELQYFWLFSIMTAGKNADATSKLLHSMFIGIEELPFTYLKRFTDGGLYGFLRYHRVGQYNRIWNAIRDSLNLNLKTCTLEELLSVRGVGPKTARFFLLHSRKGCKYAVLDTHILRWMGEIGGIDVPKTTPSHKRYEELEKVFFLNG